MNGSSSTGNCSNVATVLSSAQSVTRCNAPTSSVLFDGNIPTLTGLDGDMWASQLFTLQTTNSLRREIIFDFTGTSGYIGVKRIELTMFLCPEWEISVQTIRFLTAPSIDVSKLTVAIFPVPTITSCDSLVRICIPQIILQPVIGLEFIPPPDSTWTHLAEVTFYDSGSCPPDTIITTSPPDTTAPPTTAITTPTENDSKQAWAQV